MLERYFHLKENGTSVRTEVWAGVTTFLTMAYIIVVQPQVLSGRFAGLKPAEHYLDFGAVMVATCLSAALATAIMGLYARYPIAQAPGMGENFVFVFSLIPAAAAMIAAAVERGELKAGATTPWQVALGVVFLAGLAFLLLSACGVREALLGAVSPSMRAGIAAGIGLFIAFIGLEGATLVVASPGTLVKLNPHLASPDVLVFLIGLLGTAALHARGVRGSIFWGILLATIAAVGLKLAFEHGWLPAAWAAAAPVAESRLVGEFELAGTLISRPPSLEPTLLKLDVVRACWRPMWPFIFLFLFMNLFDTLGTLMGVAEQAGLIHEGRLPRARQALVSDAAATVFGAAAGTSTVVSYIESAAGVEEGGRTGLTALVTAALFVLALFFEPLVRMLGSYPSITAAALVVVGSMMLRNVTKIEWANYAEAMPAFFTLAAIPLSYSIADGLALGFVSYPAVKLLAGQGRQVGWLSYLLAIVLAAYLVFVRSRAG